MTPPGRAQLPIPSLLGLGLLGSIGAKQPSVVWPAVGYAWTPAGPLTHRCELSLIASSSSNLYAFLIQTAVCGVPVRVFFSREG